MSTKAQRSEKLDIRLSPDAKSMLQQAAEARHKTLSEFVLDSAIGAAESVLKARSVVRLDDEQWARFVAALDAPPRRHARLERLLREGSVFD